MKFKILIFFGLVSLVVACRMYDTKVNDEPLPVWKSRFTGIIDGTRYVWQADSVGYVDTSVVLTQFGGDSSFNSYASILEKPGIKRFLLARERLGYQGNSPSQFDFKNFFLPGNYSFYSAAPNYAQSGFSIIYTQGATEFTTAGAISTQTPGGFRVVSQVDGLNNRGDYQVNVVCRFNCILYGTGGNSLSVTQAEYRGSFVYK